MEHLTRSHLLRRAALAAGTGAAAAWMAAPASAAPSEQDLVWVRFAITSEFVLAELYREARRSGVFTGPDAAALQRGSAAALAHYRMLREALMGAGQTPIDVEDLEVTFPADAFSTRADAVRLGRRLTALAMHAYLGAVATVHDPALRPLFGQVAASAAEQRAFFLGPGKLIIGDPFPSVHGIDTASADLARFLP